MNSTFKHPSAWIPLAMSAAALVLLFVTLVAFGGVHQTDEGTAAHLWQILMAGQVPFIIYFAVKWLPITPKPGTIILGLQVFGILAACAPVFYFKL